MRSVSLNIGGSGEKGFAKLNCDMRYEHEEIRDGLVGEGQDELRINTISKYVIKGLEHRALTQASLQKQPQRSVVCWERFLPLRSLKVLLVETDQPTRFVVSALLRNCCYEVTAVSSGVQAWEILQDLTSHIDLVLTEVVMPGLSGFSLLCKIMNHKTCNNIPVITMSFHDSMGLVFKCFSNGAVDFLVKPIRKNVLKNLWQHVWRKCHSSSGSGIGNESGSESGIYVQKFQKSNAVDNYDNSTSCNDVADSVMDRSKNGDASQSSWTEQTVEVDSPNMQDQLVNYPNSICRKDVHPAVGQEWVPIAAKRNCLEHDENLLDIVAMGKDLEIGLPRIAQHDYESENASANLLTRKLEMMPESILNKENEQLYTGILELNSENPIGSLGVPCANRAGLSTNCNLPNVESIDVGSPNHVSKVLGVEDKTTSEPKDTPFLELSLNRHRVGDVGITIHDEHNIVRHSYMSAFFRCTAASTANQSGIFRRSLSLANKSKEMKMESSHKHLSIQSNHKDMGSTTEIISTKPAALDEKVTSTSTRRYLHSAFQPVHNSCIRPPLQFMPKKIDDVEAKASVTQPRHPHQKVHVQHHYYYHSHHVHKMQQQQAVPHHEDVPLDITAATLQCVSSNEIGGPIDGNGGNCSLNGSVSGSNHGSNHPNESLKDLNAGLKNTEIDIGLTIKSGDGGTSCTGSGIDQNRFSCRLAALTKFREKRKKRCFDKKVRYQSRKRLAEKRPRVCGQFVRQRVRGTTNEDSNA